jgi:serine/threonine protein kinase
LGSAAAYENSSLNVFSLRFAPTRFQVTNQQAPTIPIPIGSLIADKYRVERVLGKGGMGIVVAARHVKLDEPVAIKLMLHEDLGNQSSVERFLREARACAKLRNNEHIARVSDVDTLPSGLPYMVMELLEGYDLDRILKQRGVFQIHDACAYVVQACRALADAHQKGIIHRDLKPQNLFLAKRTDGTTCIKVLDFGISKHTLVDEVANIDLTRPSDILGSAYYMSPEQALSSRDVVPQSDIYSLGSVLYKLLTGQAPFPRRTLLDVYEALLKEKPVRPSVFRPEIPRELDTIIMRCLEKKVELRFSTALDLISALTPFTIPRQPIKVDPTDSEEVTTLPRMRAPKISPLHGTMPLGQMLSSGQSNLPQSTQPLDAKSLQAALHGYLPPRPVTRPPAPSQPQWDVARDGPTPRIGHNAAAGPAPIRESVPARMALPQVQSNSAPKNAPSIKTSPVPVPTASAMNAGAPKGTVYVTSIPFPNEPAPIPSTNAKLPEMTMSPWNAFPAVPQKSNKQAILLFMIGGAVAIVVVLLVVKLLS